ncbi:MAG: hypothetical protein ABSG74_08585 [Candidatus Bathyarchaeia archaeon]
MDIDARLTVIVSVLSLAWGVYSYFGPYLNDFWKGFSLAAMLGIVAVMVVSYIESRNQDTKRKKSFPCSKCQREISVKMPRDAAYTLLNLGPCERGDSIMFKKKCRHCKTENVRYWDREHFHGAVGVGVEENSSQLHS